MMLYITMFSREKCKKIFLMQSSPIPSLDYTQSWVLKESEGKFIIITKTAFWSTRVLYPYKQMICSLSERANGTEVNIVFKVTRQEVKKLMILLFTYWLVLLRPSSNRLSTSIIVVLMIQFVILFSVAYYLYSRANRKNETKLLEYIVNLLELKPRDTRL